MRCRVNRIYRDVFVHVVFWIGMYGKLRPLYQVTQQNPNNHKAPPQTKSRLARPRSSILSVGPSLRFNTSSKDTTKLKGSPCFQLKAYAAEAMKDKSLSAGNPKSLQFPELYTKLGGRLNSRFYIIALVSKQDIFVLLPTAWLRL